MNFVILQYESIEEHLKDQDELLAFHAHYAKQVLGLEKGATTVLCNGRIIGPLDNNEEFTNDDFSLLERFSHSTYGDKLFKNLIKSQSEDDDDYGIRILLISIKEIFLLLFHTVIEIENYFYCF